MYCRFADAGGSKETPNSQAKPVTVAFTWQTLSDTVVQAWKDYLFTPFEKKIPILKLISVPFRTRWRQSKCR